MALLIDGMYRVGNLPKPKPATPKPTPSVDRPVDGSDRKLYARAAELADDKKILTDFDAALEAQREMPPPATAAPETPTLEERAAVLERDIEALGTSGGYATNVMRAELEGVRREQRIARLQSDIDSLGTSGGYATEAMQAELEREIAEQYVPVLVIPDGKHDLSADPQRFIDNSRWREDVPASVGFSWPPIKIRDNEFGNNINGDEGDDFTAADIGQRGEEGQFLDLADNRREIGDRDAPFFYDVSLSDDPAERTKITYWFFYAYNDGPTRQNHEGDWERITVELDPVTGQPMDAICSAHSNKHTEPTPFADLETYRDPATGVDTGRPLVYVASGSHASYPTAGTHASDAPEQLRDIDTPLNFLDDHTASSVEDAAHVIDPGRNLNAVDQQDWYPGNGGSGVDWGEPGDIDDLPDSLGGGSTSGPAGPSEDKKHVELD